MCESSRKPKWDFEVGLVPEQLAYRLGRSVWDDVAEPELPTESPANQTGDHYSPASMTNIG
ncbi:hypothetical protein GCM10010371_31510 [Streptomyces subrutilus]|uniref:Uncharacterized protein n=1 Tax=Streptomyces subrutilus TaxID=36818 RepID=A0A918QR91_9ACTN|nr:hypothetical protein GCM10010371_31510 [Streptomyces subrutilus]